MVLALFLYSLLFSGGSKLTQSKLVVIAVAATGICNRRGEREREGGISVLVSHASIVG